jgi:hypothetical protein
VTGELYSESVITFQVVHMGCHVMEEFGSMCDREIVELVPHRKWMVGEHNIKVGAVLTHQPSLLGLIQH